MAAHPVPEPKPSPEAPLLALFAVLVIGALIPICVPIVAPSTVAVVTVMGFAVAITAVLSYTIGHK